MMEQIYGQREAFRIHGMSNQERRQEFQQQVVSQQEQQEEGYHWPVALLPGYITFHQDDEDSDDQKENLRHRHNGTTTTRNKMYRFHKEIAWVKRRYGEDIVRVVRLTDMRIEEQVDLMRKTALFVTSEEGSASSMSLFLPRGAGTLLFWDEGKNGTGKEGYSFLESVEHVRATWIGVVHNDEGEEEEQHSSTMVNRTIALMERELELSVQQMA